MNKLLTIIIAIFCLTVMIGLLPVRGEAEIYDSVIRLHVLANSDSEEDQALKLKVRDALLAASAEFVFECDDIEEAKTVFCENMAYMQLVAERCVEENGYSYPVTVELGEERYPTRNYEGFCFPSGEYLSLRVKIGDAEGKNWWCVLFPPMCMSVATKYSSLSAADALINIGFTSEQYKLITESDNSTYKIRFKILESFESVLS